MRKHFFCILILLFCIPLFVGFSIAKASLSANVISYDWKISKDTTCDLSNKQLDISGWNDINIGVSWEHQGYFYASGELILANRFNMPDLKINVQDTIFYAIVNLQGKVQEVYLNGKKIAGRVTFKGSSPDKIAIPISELNQNSSNLLAIRIKDVKWTGGTCKNEVSLSNSSFGSPETIRVSTNVKDCLFRKNDDLLFTISHSLNNLSDITIQVISDFHKKIETIVVSPKQLNSELQVKLKKRLYKPGFYHLIVSTEPPFYVQNDMWIAVDPEQISCSNTNIPDLKAWWSNTIKNLESIASQIKLTKLQNEGNAFKDVYELKFISLDSIEIYGYVSVPKKEGKFPAILHVPGYSLGYTLQFLLNNNDDVVELGLCIRGHGASTKTINPGFGLLGFVGYNICDYNKYVYKGAYMDCLRAIDILRSLPQVDSSRVAVMGGSQGGGLSLATAALAGNKVKVCVALCPFLSDMEHFDAIREVFGFEKRAFANTYQCSLETIDKSLSYVDTKNMASWITASVFLGTGLFDDDCPPHVGFVAYNKITSKKRFKIYPQDGHMLKTGESDGLNFIKEQFNL